MKLDDAEQLANELMAHHGLHVNGWRFAFDQGSRTFGRCWHAPRKTITLSRLLTHHNDESEVRNTILHEIAHALCGPFEGHGPLWHQVCVEIGAKPQRCYSAAEVNVPPRTVRMTPPGRKG